MTCGYCFFGGCYFFFAGLSWCLCKPVAVCWKPLFDSSGNSWSCRRDTSCQERRGRCRPKSAAAPPPEINGGVGRSAPLCRPLNAHSLFDTTAIHNANRRLLRFHCCRLTRCISETRPGREIGKERLLSAWDWAEVGLTLSSVDRDMDHLCRYGVKLEVSMALDTERESRYSIKWGGTGALF